MNNEVKQEASGVERYKVPDDYVGVVRHKGYGHVEVVTAADHDRIVAEKDATIAELREEVAQLDTQNGEVCCHGYAPYTPADYEVLVARAEAAEAEVARLKLREKEINALAETCDEGGFDAVVNVRSVIERLSECRLDLKEIGKTIGCYHTNLSRCVEEYVADITAQLAAANERVAALEKERDGLREVLEIAKAACEKNLCYAHYKDEQSLYKALAIINKQLSQPKGGE